MFHVLRAVALPTNEYLIEKAFAQDPEKVAVAVDKEAADLLTLSVYYAQEFHCLLANALKHVPADSPLAHQIREGLQRHNRPDLG